MELLGNWTIAGDWKDLQTLTNSIVEDVYEGGWDGPWAGEVARLYVVVRELIENVHKYGLGRKGMIRVFRFPDKLIVETRNSGTENDYLALSEQLRGIQEYDADSEYDIQIRAASTGIDECSHLGLLRVVAEAGAELMAYKSNGYLVVRAELLIEECA